MNGKAEGRIQYIPWLVTDGLCPGMLWDAHCILHVVYHRSNWSCRLFQTFTTLNFKEVLMDNGVPDSYRLPPVAKL